MSKTLFGMGIGRSFRTLWAAEELELDYQYIQLAFAGKGEQGNQGETYKKLNPQGKVPTFVDGDLVVTESAAIVNYMAAQKPELGLIPQDGTAARVKYDEICFFILSDFEQPIWTKGKHKNFLPEALRLGDEFADTLTYEFEKSQQALIVLMGGTTYAAGERFTMADVLLCHTLNWAQRFNFSIEQGLLDYKNKLELRPAYQKAMQKAHA